MSKRREEQKKAKKKRKKNFLSAAGTSKRRIKALNQRKGIYSKNSPFYNATEEGENEQ